MDLPSLKKRIDEGTPVVGSRISTVVDIGNGLIVKYGTRVSDVEVEAARMV
jgi:CRISPR/Cas system Type II protein with McrA/HNH and RuvC-like nuclease domain